jgi:hypothetical protein
MILGNFPADSQPNAGTRVLLQVAQPKKHSLPVG